MVIGIIGAGASGMAAALAAAEHPGVHVVLLERQARVGRKLGATGNGRCNLTNTHALEGGYHGDDAEFVRPALEKHGPAETLEWFADLGLYTDSFRAAETTFNMLTQVVGRAGRGDAPGEALIQTVVPNHKVIELAAKQDYDGFFELEQQMRRIQECPPFGDLAAITFFGQEEARVLRSAAKFRDSLLACLKQPAYSGEICRVLGPAPCAVPTSLWIT